MNLHEHLDIEIVGKFMQSAPVDVRRLAKTLGIAIAEIDLPPDVSGQIAKDPSREGKYLITVNAKHGENRKRFTIAHEIAHYVLHRDKIGDGVIDNAMYRSNSLSTSIERQANRYAADILMPWRLVVEDTAFGSSSALATKFKVSSKVAEIRMKELESFSGRHR